jgi:glutaredoxin
MAYTIYGKQDCPPCDEAKRLLSEAGKEYTYLEWNVDYTTNDLIAATGIFIPAMPRIIYEDGNTKLVLKNLTSLHQHLNNL